MGPSPTIALVKNEALMRQYQAAVSEKLNQQATKELEAMTRGYFDD
jgi:hypothetical protein